MPKKQPAATKKAVKSTLVKKSAVPRTQLTAQKPKKVKKTARASRPVQVFPVQNSVQRAQSFLSDVSRTLSARLQNARTLSAKTFKNVAQVASTAWKTAQVATEDAVFHRGESFSQVTQTAGPQLSAFSQMIMLFSLAQSEKLRKWTAAQTEKAQESAQKNWPVFKANLQAKLLVLRKKSWIASKALFHELVYPFYYLFRYHFFATTFSILTTLIIFGGAYATYEIGFRDLPSVALIAQRQQPLTTKILDRNGKLLYSIYKDENRTLIPLSDVPDDLKHATVAIEDRDFYRHHGISVKGILRAAKENLEGGKLQGGSTITQQLVKNTLLTSEKTYKRKIREIILSFLVEQTYSKDEILEMYLNEVAYGGSTYGIEEASQRYFGKPARSLDLAESSFLAGLPQSPSQYSPFGSTPELAATRQHEVLRRMVEDNYITQEQADQARDEQLTFRNKSIDIQAPHFVMYVKDLLAQTYGEEMINQGGLEVKTTLDLDLHNKVQDVVSKEMATLARLRISNGAALVTNPKTGEVLSMVGSKDYFDFAHDGQVNVTTRPRQPGSSIKPLTYALAFERGMSPSSTVLDEPTTFAIPGSAPYSPKNYDGRFHGNVTLREALASSYNIPAVKTLASVGISNMIDKAQEMGVTTWSDRNRFGLSLTLGGGEVKMTELAQIYGTFANQGMTTQLQPILEVKNSKGEVLYHNSCALDGKDCPATRTLSTKTTVQITDVLTDNNARSPAFGPRSVLNIPGQQVAVKTGTTNSLRDNWTVGYTDDRVVAVWVGNNDNTPMSYVASGITGASPIWNKITRLMLSDAQPHTFKIPDGMVRVKICVQTKTLACRGCPTVRDELFDSGTEPKTACSPSQFRPPEPKPTASPTPRDQILNGATTP